MKLSKKEYQSLVTSIKVVPLNYTNDQTKSIVPSPAFWDNLDKYWLILKAILTAIKFFTKPAIDLLIDAFIALINDLLKKRIIDPSSPKIKTFDWSTFRAFLVTLKANLRDKEAKIVDAIIDFCDNLFPTV